MKISKEGKSWKHPILSIHDNNNAMCFDLINLKRTKILCNEIQVFVLENAEQSMRSMDKNDRRDMVHGALEKFFRPPLRQMFRV